jgi:hypothetical protein
MAHLEVKPKSKASWWLWLLLAIIALALILFFVKRYYSGERANGSIPDTTVNSTAVQGNILATTVLDWNSIDVKSIQT